MLMPGVAFDLSDPGKVRPTLHNIRKLTAIVTYGRPRWMEFYMGDPPRKIMTRYLPWFIAPRAPVRYHALYHMNVATPERRAAFISRVASSMASF